MQFYINNSTLNFYTSTQPNLIFKKDNEDRKSDVKKDNEDIEQIHKVLVWKQDKQSIYYAWKNPYTIDNMDELICSNNKNDFIKQIAKHIRKRCKLNDMKHVLINIPFPEHFEDNDLNNITQKIMLTMIKQNKQITNHLYGHSVYLYHKDRILTVSM